MSVVRLPGRIRAAARLALIFASALLLAGCEVRLGNFVSVLDDERAVAKALEVIRSNYKGPIRVFKIVLADDGMALQARHPSLSRLVEWRLMRLQHFGYINIDRVSGPHDFDAPSDSNLDSRLFNLDEVNLSGWGKLADDAIAHAKLEEKAGVFTVEVARPSVVVRDAPSGPVRWTVEVKSESESARIFANAKGEITGANLNGTRRMRNVNMYQRPELAAEAAAEMRLQAGNKPILLSVSVYSHSISFETNLQDSNHPIGGLRLNATYGWSHNGLQREMGRTHIPSSNPDQPFAIDDVDWTLLPNIVADAKAKLATPNGRVTSISVSKPSDSVGTAAPRWKILIEEKGERSEYLADVKGVAKLVLPPPSKRKPAAWLDPDVMAQTLARVASDFGPGGQIVKIFIDRDGGRVVAEDSRKPGHLMEALLREDGLKRWGTPMFESGKPFAARELEAFTAERISKMLERALKELDMPDARLRDITIARDVLGISKLGKVTVAMLVLRPNGRQGRVVQALDGTIVEVYKP